MQNRASVSLSCAPQLGQRFFIRLDHSNVVLGLGQRKSEAKEATRLMPETTAPQRNYSPVSENSQALNSRPNSGCSGLEPRVRQQDAWRFERRPGGCPNRDGPSGPQRPPPSQTKESCQICSA